MRLRVVLFLGIVITTFWAKGQSKQQLKALNEFKYVLLNYTGNPYLYTDSAELEQAFDRARWYLRKERSIVEIYRTYGELISLIRDGHTRIHMNRELGLKYYENYNCPPLDVVYINGKLLVVKSRGRKNQIDEGDEILTINWDSLNVIVEKMYSHMSGDGFNNSLKERELKYFFWKHYYLYVEEYFDECPRTMVFEVKKANGQIITEELNTILPFHHRKNEGFSLENEILASQSSNYPTLTMIDDYALLKIQTFHNKNDERYRTIMEEHIARIYHSKVPNLIIDLRGNMGGRVETLLSGFLTGEQKIIVDFDMQNSPGIPDKGSFKKNYSYRSMKKELKTLKKQSEMGIVDPKELNCSFYSVIPNESDRFNGNLAVLVDQYTFSAGAIFASFLRANSDAVIIGQETGGSYLQGNTGRLIYKTKWKRFYVTINPTYYKVHVEAVPDLKGGVVPDIFIEEEIFEGDQTDQYIERAVNYFNRDN